MAECGCPGESCKFKTVDDLQDFVRAIRVLYEAGAKSLGPCNLCKRRKATTLIDRYHLPYKNQALILDDFEVVVLCGECYRYLRSPKPTEPGATDNDSEAMF